MLEHRGFTKFTSSVLAGAVAGISLLVIAAGITGCDKRKQDGSNTTEATAPATSNAAGGAEQTPEELATPLAKVDGAVITVGEFQDRINRQSPYIRARYTSIEQKKEFLDTLIRFEVLAKEAAARGFDKDPEVVRTMKQAMIQKLMKDEFEDKITPESITDEEMKAFYEANKSEYNKPEEARVAAIILDDKAKADAVAKEASGEAGAKNKGFRDLVTTHSVDEESKIRGGDLRYFQQDTTEIPKPVVDAAFSLQKTGDVTGPVDSGDGRFYIIKLTGRRRAISKSFDDVKRQIQNRIYRDKRTQTQRDFITGLRNKATIDIFDDVLNNVRSDTSATGTAGGGHGMPATVPDEPDDDGHSIHNH